MHNIDKNKLFPLKDIELTIKCFLHRSQCLPKSLASHTQVQLSVRMGTQVPPFVQGAEEHGFSVCCCGGDGISDESFASLAVVKARTATTIVGTMIHGKKTCKAKETSTSFFRFPSMPARYLIQLVSISDTESSKQSSEYLKLL